MKHFYLKELLLCLLSIITTKTFAYDCYIGGICYNLNGTDKTAAVTNDPYKKYNSDIKIPETIIYLGKTYTVTSIESEAFKGCSSLISIEIPNSVTTIGTWAFYGCYDLTSVTIPNSVAIVGSEAFKFCNSLTQPLYNSLLFIYMPTSYKGNFEIPEGITTICASAFAGCSNLISITIPSSIIDIKDGAFGGCSGLTKVTLNSNSITSATYGSYGKTIGSIFGSQVLEYVIGDNVTSIGKNAFYKCKNLTSIIIPASVTSIGDYTFAECTNLTSITIPNSVTSIGDYTFAECTNLTSITIPNSVTNIGLCAFNGCTGIKSPIYNSNFFIYMPTFYEGNYEIPVGINVICNDALSGCSGLTDVKIPHSVATIGSYAFEGCTGLTSITIPDSVTIIGNDAFNGCTGLASINIPCSVTSIGYDAFSGCISLAKVTLNNITITSKTYTDKSNIANIFGTQVSEYIIGDDVTSIGVEAFSGCTGLTSITFPASLTRIGYHAFWNCNDLTTVILPDNISSMASFVFPWQVKLLTRKGTKTLLALWSSYSNIIAYDADNPSKEIPRPSLSVLGKTQTSITATYRNIIEGYSYSHSINLGNWSNLSGNPFKVTGLRPEQSVRFDLNIALEDVVYATNITEKTQDIKPSLSLLSTTATSISAKGSYIEGDAMITKNVLTIGNEQTEGIEATTYGLDPNRNYTVTYEVSVAYGENNEQTYTYSDTKYIYTDDLTLTTLQPKVVSVGNVIVSADSNLDDEETNVGFEWRRTDWTDEFPSNMGSAYLYEGTMEGYIRNLNAEKLWKVRPYYESNSGNRYYGEWIGLDPSNTSYFEPTVHTFAKVEVQGNTATVKGYAQRGTDNVVSQGFKYWKQVAGTRGAASGIHSDALTAEATGTVMQAQLTGLDYESEYCYVAYVTTSENETFYGEQQTFKTGIDTSGIEDTRMAVEPVEVVRYDLRGRCLDMPQRGLNIIKLSDGTIRKVMVK